MVTVFMVLVVMDRALVEQIDCVQCYFNFEMFITFNFINLNVWPIRVELNLDC